MADITTAQLARYGLLALPVAFAGFPLYVLGPDYYATQHGVSLTLLAGLLLAIRGFDAIQDPLFGWIIDRKRHWLGALSMFAGMLLCAAIFALFNMVVISPAWWFAICMFFAVTAYSVLTIAMGATATLWTTDRATQTRIAGAREGFALIGLVIAVSLPALFSSLVDTDGVYLWYSACLALFMLAGLIAFSRTLKSIGHVNGIAASAKGAPVPFTVAFKGMPQETRKLLAVYGFSMLAASVPAVLVVFFVRDKLGVEPLLGVFMLLYFMSGVAGMPLWKKASVQIGKPQAWALAGLLSITGFAGAFFLAEGDVYAYAAVCVASGLALGADLTLPPSMLADHIHARANHRFAATHYACLSFIAKASLAVASALALPALDLAGFVPNTDNSASALTVLSLTYAVVPCLLKLIAIAFIYGFFVRGQQRAE